MKPLTERLLQLDAKARRTLMDLGRFGFATPAQLEAFAGSDALIEAGLLRLVTLPQQQLFYLTRTGLAAARALGDDVRALRPEAALFAEHAMWLLDVYLGLRRKGLPWDRFLPEQPIRFSSLVYREGIVIPDAQIVGPGQSVLLELDRGTEQPRQWRQKVERYRELYRETERTDLIVISADNARLTRLQSLTPSLPKARFIPREQLIEWLAGMLCLDQLVHADQDQKGAGYDGGA